ncbi:MAG: hypothetical protein WCK31_03415, partial [bacterium]
MDKTKHLSWKLDELYSSINDSKLNSDLEVFTLTASLLSEKWKNDDSYLSDPSKLKILLDEINIFEETFAYGGKPSYYIDLLHFLDNQNTEVLGKYSLVQKYINEASNELHFIVLKLSKLDKEEQDALLSSSILKEYHKYLSDIFKYSKHILPESEQNIVNELSDLASEAWNRMLTGLLSSEKAIIKDKDGIEKEYHFEKITDLFNSSDKILRDNAALAFNQILNKYSKIAEAEFNATLGYKEKIDKIKHFDYPEMERHLSDDVEIEVVKNLREVIAKNIDIPR